MRVGLDIGSTTIKCVVLNDAGQIVYSTYERHFSHILEKGRALLEKVAAEYLPDGRAYLAISGSAGMGLADSCKVPFVQEVFATRVAANRLTPGTDCIIELGGEDAKILFLTNGTEVRMNGSCAGGTGAFILTDYVSDNTMTFVANPNYWEKDADGNQLPYLGTIKLVHMSDTATMLSSFIGGDLQALMANNILIDRDQASQLKDGTYTKYTYSNDCPAVCIKLGDNPVPALADVNVRTAMQYAIDSDAISQYQGYTYANDNDKNVSLFYKGLAIYNPDVPSAETKDAYVTYDPDKAKQMLTDAGYGDGFSFDVYLFQAQPIDSFKLAAEYLAKVGITMNINVVSTPPEMTAHGADRTDPASMYGSVGTSRMSSISAVIRSDGPMNNVFQDNAEIDQLCDKFANATTVDEQKAAADELNEAVLAQHYFLITSYAQTWDCYVASNVHGFTGARWTLCYNAGEIMSHLWVDEA